MPHALVAGEYVEVKAYCQNDAQQAINSYFFQVGSVVGGVFTDETMASQIGADLATLYKPWLPSVCRYNGVRVQVLGIAPRPVYQISRSGAGVGARASAPLPSLTALLVSKFTQMGGSAGRGRTYLPFWSEADNDANGLPEAAGVALADALALYIFSPVVFLVGGVTLTLNPVLWNRFTSTGTPITSYVIRDTTWYHQVRRANDNRPDVLGP